MNLCDDQLCRRLFYLLVYAVSIDIQNDGILCGCVMFRCPNLHGPVYSKVNCCSSGLSALHFVLSVVIRVNIYICVCYS